VNTPVRIVGCGRWAMGDDQAGLLAAEGLRDASLPDASVTLEEAPGAGLADESLGEVELLIVIDAARADCRHPAGSFRRVDHRACGLGISTVSGIDTHTLGVTGGLDLAAALGVLPSQVWIYVIFGQSFDRCLTASAAVGWAVPRLVRRIKRDVARWVEARLCTS